MLPKRGVSSVGDNSITKLVVIFRATLLGVIFRQILGIIQCWLDLLAQMLQSYT